MEILIRVQCLECRKSLIVDDNEVEDERVSGPHCGAAIDLSEDDE